MSGTCTKGYYCPEGSISGEDIEHWCPQGAYCEKGVATFTNCPSGQNLTPNNFLLLFFFYVAVFNYPFPHVYFSFFIFCYS